MTSSQPIADTETEDNLYLSYICMLVLIDSESQAATPDLPRIQYLRAKADADRAELEVISLRLSLMPKNEADQLKAQLLQAAETALKGIEASALDSLDQNAQSHPKVVGRNLKVNLERTCGEAAAKVEASGNQLLSDVRAKIARARRLEGLLQEATIAKYKRKIAAELQTADGKEPP